MSTSSPKPLANVKCEPQPSTSTANEASLPLSSPCHPSPALARSVPSSQEATSPSETAGKDFVYFTTELANQAALDFEKERFDSLLEWHMKYRKRKEAERASSEDTVSEKATSSVSTESTGTESTEKKAEKRKAESDPDESVAKKPTYIDLTAPESSSTKKVEETPLRRMEMMTNSSAFSTSSSINDVVEAPANGICKKDERSAKLEKLGEMERQVEAERLRVEWEKEVQAHEVVRHYEEADAEPGAVTLYSSDVSTSTSTRDERSAKLEKLGEMERQVEAERLRVEWEKEVQAHEMKKLMQNQGLSPYTPPMFPPAPAPGATGGMYPMCAYPGRYPPVTNGYPVGAMPTGGYAQGYPGAPPSYPPGYPMSAPGKSQIPSPAYIGDPMPYKAGPPPGMSPHHPMYAHMMAARVSGPAFPGDPGRPFGMPGQSPGVSPFHPMPYPPQPYPQIPYGHPAMAKVSLPFMS
ncbi:hypothetical protein OESDEN_07385 [Oesophagostomum dentatum]|uniref:Uncharacterized protein n=1 Tax=Oesophagostomum dentatum TaxID=61180 RepID=A0A0B1T9B2_OESDE|nr:hypothetical protein OESDEN_07385 [Oesophagostomum dentatum]